MSSSTESGQLNSRAGSVAPFRILFVLGSSSGGVVRHVAQAADELVEREGTRLQIRVVGPQEHSGRFAAHSFGLVPIGPQPHLRDGVNVLRLRRAMVGADVVHAHGLRSGALAVLAARSLAGRRRPRVVVTLHNLTVGSRRIRLISRGLERIVARGADVVLGVSSDIVESVRGLGTHRALRALIPAPGGFAKPERTCEQVRSALGIPPTTAVVLTVGRLAHQKGLDTLLDAAALLDEKLARVQATSEVVWLIAGSGPRETELAERIRAQELPVRLLGARADVADLLASADVVVSTAIWEGQPIGIQEALHAGVAIVATDAGGTREVTGDGGAVIVPVGDAHEIAEQTARLLAEPKSRGLLRQAARERSMELPQPPHMVSQLLDAYGYPKRPN